jgi:predicted cobalt transporter CbtA
MRTLLLHGLLAGLLAGLCAGTFAYAFGEPALDRAIGLEATSAVQPASHAHAAGAATGPAHAAAAGTGEAAPFGRGAQRSGLFLGAALYGIGIGALFALVYAAVFGRLLRGRPLPAAATLAGMAFVAVALVPALKYPARPPGIGSPETIEQRTWLFLAMICISIAAAVAAVRLARSAAARWSPRVSVPIGVLAFAAIATTAALSMPAVGEIPAGFPPSLLQDFQLASLGTQLVLWLALGLTFGLLSLRAVARERGGAALGEAGLR